MIRCVVYLAEKYEITGDDSCWDASNYGYILSCRLMDTVDLCWIIVGLCQCCCVVVIVAVNFVDNVKLYRILNDNELPLFIGNNGDVGLCLVMDDDCCEYVIVHSLSHIHLHTLWWPGLENCEEGLWLVDASIYWQIFKMRVLIQWYHMHLHHCVSSGLA